MHFASIMPEIRYFADAGYMYELKKKHIRNESNYVIYSFPTKCVQHMAKVWTKLHFLKTM